MANPSASYLRVHYLGLEARQEHQHRDIQYYDY